MEKVLLIITLALSMLSTAQNNFEQGMQQAFSLWGENKNSEAAALFDRIAQVEKDSWLPGYYAALVNTTTAFSTQDTQKVTELLTQAQKSLDEVLLTHENNAEILVMQAMIHTAWVAHDPMTYAQKLSPVILALYIQAEQMEPQNPRVVSSKAQFDLGSAQYFGADTTSICERLKNSLELFDNFKPETPFHPNWGKEYTEQEIARNCK